MKFCLVICLCFVAYCYTDCFGFPIDLNKPMTVVGVIPEETEIPMLTTESRLPQRTSWRLGSLAIAMSALERVHFTHSAGGMPKWIASISRLAYSSIS